MGTTNVLPPSLGTKLKIGFTAEISGSNLTLDDVDFECEVVNNFGKGITIKKAETVRVDKDNRIVTIDSLLLGRGEYTMLLHLFVPDVDFEDGIRDEVVRLNTGIKVK